MMGKASTFRVGGSISSYWSHVSGAPGASDHLNSYIPEPRVSNVAMYVLEGNHLFTGVVSVTLNFQSDFHIGCMLNLTIMCQGGDALYCKLYGTILFANQTYICQRVYCKLYDKLLGRRPATPLGLRLPEGHNFRQL